MLQFASREWEKNITPVRFNPAYRETWPRIGLCCTFAEQPIAFRRTTVAAVSRLSRRGSLEKLAEIASHNASALQAALEFCALKGIGSFRINNEIMPVRTHPKMGYVPELLPNGRQIVRAFRDCGDYAAEQGLRTLFHPDQYVVLNSPNPAVTENAIAELEHLAELAEWTHADVLIVHGGGAYGEKIEALARLEQQIVRLPPQVRRLLAIENDERVFSPADILPVCGRTKIPFVYDVHHHRCFPDDLSVEAATRAAVESWEGREPLFHISSPLDGWQGPKPSRHHDYIDPADFPACWKSLRVTVEIEAKAKELAVLRLKNHLDATMPETG